MLNIPRPKPTQLILIHSLLWFCIVSMLRVELDFVGDMTENYSWGQVFQWGTFKHPPFFSWITGLWFRIVPENNVNYYLLSYFNVALSLLGILKLAQLFQEKTDSYQAEFLWWVVGFAALAFPYSFLTAKYNANSAMLPLWPWTAYFFILSINLKSKHPILTSLALGLMGSLCLLTKYYSGVLLLSLFLISLSSPAYRRWYLTIYPYIALSTAALLLLPHLLWLSNHDFPCFTYLESKFGAETKLSQKFSYIWAGFYYQLIPWILFSYFMLKVGENKKYINSYRYNKEQTRTLILLTILPLIITIIFGVVGHVKVSSVWTIPLWYPLPILMVTLLKPMINQQNTDLLWRFMISLWSLFMLLFILILGYILFKGSPKLFQARKEMAFAIQQEWKKQNPHQPLFQWVAGDWAEASALSFYLSSHPRSLPGFPDQNPALMSSYTQWQTQNGVLICHPPREVSEKNLINFKNCIRTTELWLKNNNMPVIKSEINYQSHDWRALKANQKQVVLYWYNPKNKLLAEHSIIEIKPIHN